MSVLSPTVEEIDALALSNQLNEVQFAQPPDPAALEALEWKILRKRPDFEVRFYGFYKTKCDLRFLRYIPSVRKLVVNCISGEIEGVDQIAQLRNLVSLKVGIEQLESFDFLNGVPSTLEVLYLEEAKRKSLSLQALPHFRSLRRLYIERHHKDLELVGTLSNLKELVLRSITVPSLSFLCTLDRLQQLDLKLGGTTNLDALPTLSALSQLAIWQIRKLADLSSIALIPGLEILYLEDLPNVTQFPSFARMKHLREVHLHHLRGVTNISPIAEAPALEWFSLTDATRCSSKTFEPMLNHPTLRRIGVGLGSFRKNREVRSLFAQSGIEVGPEQAFRVARREDGL